MARKDPIAHLGRHPDSLPTKLVEEILALGEPGIDRLLEIAADRGPPHGESDGSVVVVNALQVFARARHPRALPVLVDRLADAPFGSRLYQAAVWALGHYWGSEVVEAVLARPLDPERRPDAAELLAYCDVPDPRIQPLLEELVDADPERGAAACVAYRDAALAPALQRAFDRIDRTRIPSPEDAERADMLVRAITVLGVVDEVRSGQSRDLTVLALSALRDEELQLREETRVLREQARMLEALAREQRLRH